MINQLELNDETEISKRIRIKFNKEGLSKYVNVISYECANSIIDICNVLASTPDDVENYVNEELG